ncbi:MAG: hypothetical protein MK101_01290 [Phycisphaerales bacterium]|nr:hypothetical protein [Phycisphaerales bacterium]
MTCLAIEHIPVQVLDDPADVSHAVAAEIAAIYRHESQKDKALFPGDDQHEFWQRAEDRNRATARVYDALGLAEYEAIEAFVRWSTINSATTPMLVAKDADEA